MKPLLVLNLDKCIPGTDRHLRGLGYDVMGADDQDTPPVELVVGVDDRRFAAALRVLATMIGNISASGEQLFEMRAALAFAAVSQADALLVELAKEPS